MFKATIFALVISSMACHAEGQAMYRKITGTEAGGNFGHSVCALGDLDGDGVTDFAVTAPATTGPGTALVNVYSGRYVQLLFTIMPPLGSSPNFASSIAPAGDWDGDGRPDIAIMTAAPLYGNGQGHLRIASGQDGSFLKTISSASATAGWGISMAAVGDRDGDGRIDFLVGAPTDDTAGINFGAAYVVSSFTGANIRSYFGTSSAPTTGDFVANVGDLNTDGIEDYAIYGFGSPGYLVYSGSTGNFITYLGADFLGFIAGIGDINNDGIGDVIASHIQSGSTVDSVVVLSGFDSSILHLINAAANMPDLTGGRVIGSAGDYDGDGTPDYYRGVHNSVLGSFSGILITSGATHLTIGVIDSPSLYDAPDSCALLGDLNGDGHNDFVIGDIQAANHQGMVQLSYGHTTAVEAYHSTNSGLTETLVLGWQGHTAGKLVATGATPGALGLAAASFAPGDFVAYGLPILISFDVPNLAATGTIGATFAGELVVGNLDRKNPILAGLPIYIQFYEVSPIPGASNGLRIVYSD